MTLVFKNFRNDEDGAVTVDWVVLCAAMVGLAFAVVTPVAEATDEYAGDVAVCTRIVGNRMAGSDGTAVDYQRELRRMERACARPR